MDLTKITKQQLWIAGAVAGAIVVVLIGWPLLTNATRGAEAAPGGSVSPAASVPSTPISGDAVTVTDYLDREVTFDQTLDTVAIDTGYTVELFGAVAGFDKIVGIGSGVTEYVPYADLSNAQEFASGSDINYDLLVQLKPDLVVLNEYNSPEEKVSRLEELGIPVLIFSPWRASQWQPKVEAFGALFGAEDRAQEIIQFSSDFADGVPERLAGAEETSVYWENERTLTYVNDDSRELFPEGYGVRNIAEDEDSAAGDAGGQSVTLDPAYVLEKDPDVIIIKTDATPEGRTQEELAAIAADYLARPGWENLTAVKTGNFYVYDAYPLYVSGYKFVPFYHAYWLHPEELSDLVPSEYLATYLKDYLGVDYKGDDAYIYQYQP